MSVDLVLVPTGNGSTNAWAVQQPASGAHWDKVDDYPDANSADCILTSSTVATHGDLLELYTFSPGSVMGGQISNVRISHYTHAYGGSAFIKSAVKTHGSVYYAPEISIATNDWVIREHSQDFSVNPATSEQWNWSEIYALEAGISGRRSLAGNSAIKLTCLKITITYTESTSNTNIPVGDFGIY